MNLFTKTVGFIFLNFILLFGFSKSLLASDAEGIELLDCLEFVEKVSGIDKFKLIDILKDESEAKKFIRKQALRIHPDKCGSSDSSLCGNHHFVHFNKCIASLKTRKITIVSKVLNDSQPRPWLCSYASEEFCKAHSETCVWDETGNYCLDNRYSPCTNSLNPSSCQANNCVWNSIKCISKWTTFCTAANEDVCNKIPGCVWDDKKDECFSHLTSSCRDMSDDACTKLGCVWDTKAQNCLDKKSSRCEASTEPTSCKNLKKCTWNGLLQKCMNIDFQCKDLNIKHCHYFPNCVWDNVNHCINKINTWCMYASEENICARLSGCMWINISGISLCMPSFTRAP